MALRRITPPTEPLVSLAEAKAQCRVDHADQDALIERMVEQATSYLDGYSGIIGQALVTQTWELVLDRFPCGPVQIPLGPLQSVTSVKHDDSNGDELTFDAANYVVDNVSKPGWVVLNRDASWPATLDAVNAVRIRFVCGFGAPSEVPAAIRGAVLMLVGDFYANREASIVGTNAQELPFSVNMLIAPFRRVFV